MIDLRSDTVTHPTPQMREAMARAEVGDDVYGEDPTVNRLEELAASKLGKEAAVFVASGTMGNLIALLTHCGRGDEVIIGRQQHSFNSEAGGMAALGGITPYPLLNQPDGTLALDEIEHAIRHEDEHYPRTRLVVIENTHNYCGGQPLTVEYTRRVREIVSAHNLNLHIDGARIFNAAIALGVDVHDLVKDADSIQFCLSKGLSAPVGSLLVGSKDFIGRARRNRKMVGGGMRQAGIIAAAGIVALETMIDRLAEDHANAKYFAENLADLPGISLDPARVKTNIVFYELTNGVPAEEMQARLEKRGVLIFATGQSRMRAVTHYGITRADIENTLDVFAKVLREN